MNKPTFLKPFILVYKVVLFLFKLPIMFIRYFSLGFFFVGYYLISIIVNTAINFIKNVFNGFVFSSYLVYSFFKLILHPIALIFRKKDKKQIKNKKIIINNKKPEVKVKLIKPQKVKKIKVRKPISLKPLLYPFKGFVVLSYFIYRFIKLVLEGLVFPFVLIFKKREKQSSNIKIKEKKVKPIKTPKVIKNNIESSKKVEKQPIKFSLKPLLYPFKGFVVLSYLIYRFIKLVFEGLIFPFILIIMLFIKIIRYSKIAMEKSKAQKDRQRLQRIQDKKRKEELDKKRKREAIERKRKQKEKNEYLNENVKIERKKFSDYINDFLIAIANLPKKIKKSIVDSYNNSALVKNKKNKDAIERQALLINFDGEDAEKSDKKVLYEYVGKNADGKIVKGYMEAFSKVEVHSFLLSEGMEVYSIRTNRWIQIMHGMANANNIKVKTKDLIFFLTQLSTYIKSGIPLVDSLKILTKQYKNRAYQRIFRSIIYDLTMGENFSDSLAKQGNAFPRLLINMVKASEMTGELPETLDDMSEYFTEVEQTRKQMVTAMMYPAIVFVVSLAVITFIMMFVIPKFVSIYESMDNAKIPAFTQAIINASVFLENNVIWFFAGLILFMLIFYYLFKNVKMFKTFVQWTLMHLPIVGNVIIYNEVTMFTKTFGSLLSHNVFITDSMEILNKITNNEIYKMLILDTITNLAKGEKISAAFKDHWAFPIPAYEMLVTGEKTGQLPEMMKKVSVYYQELHRNAVTRIKTFVEPALIIFLTAIVGVIILSVILPMFSLYNSLQLS